MDDINFNELDDKTKLIVSKMEKVIDDKNKEIENLKKSACFFKRTNYK